MVQSTSLYYAMAMLTDLLEVVALPPLVARFFISLSSFALLFFGSSDWEGFLKYTTKLTKRDL